MEGDDGFFIKSPKSFLGARLRQKQLDVFQTINARMLGHIKTTSETERGSEIRDVVIGRPVNFHGARGEQGNRQATKILRAAAESAGYKNVEFMLEPVAAAIDFERTLDQDRLVLVVDVGGGTTDCTMLHLGPSYRDREDRQATVLAHTGDRIGGLDLDIQLAWHSFMPAFGKGTAQCDRTPVPSHIFWQACAVNDLVAQSSFLSEKVDYYHSRAQEPDKLARLLRLQEYRAMPRLHMVAEAGKVDLSLNELTDCNLSFVEPGLQICVSRQYYKAAIDRPLSAFVRLAREAVRLAGAIPDLVYVTGGTARSPIIREGLRAAVGADVDIVSGNLFEGVVSGLSIWAERIYQ